MRHFPDHDPRIILVIIVAFSACLAPLHQGGLL